MGRHPLGGSVALVDSSSISSSAVWRRVVEEMASWGVVCLSSRRVRAAQLQLSVASSSYWVNAIHQLFTV